MGWLNWSELAWLAHPWTEMGAEEGWLSTITFPELGYQGRSRRGRQPSTQTQMTAESGPILSRTCQFRELPFSCPVIFLLRGGLLNSFGASSWRRLE